MASGTLTLMVGVKNSVERADNTGKTFTGYELECTLGVYICNSPFLPPPFSRRPHLQPEPVTYVVHSQESTWTVVKRYSEFYDL